MPYSKRRSQTCIYPDTIRQLSMSARTQARLSMSTQTQAINQSFPIQWAQSQLICFNEDQLPCQQGHKLLIYQCQTHEHDLVSYPYQSEARNYQCLTNGHDLS